MASPALQRSLLPPALHVRPCFPFLLLTHSPVVGGTESLGITAGETKNPSRNMPKVVKFVFWRYDLPLSPSSRLYAPFRILLFYVLSILLIGLNGSLVVCLYTILDLCFDSPMGLSKPLKQVHHHIPFHYRVQDGRFKYVPSLVLNHHL